MQATAIDVRCSLWSVCVKMAEPIETLFGMHTHSCKDSYVRQGYVWAPPGKYS